jgi:hypothetical protein
MNDNTTSTPSKPSRRSAPLLDIAGVGAELRNLQRRYLHLSDLRGLSQSKQSEVDRGSRLLDERIGGLTNWALTQPALSPEDALTQIDLILVPIEGLAYEGALHPRLRKQLQEIPQLLVAAAAAISSLSGLDLEPYTFADLATARNRFFSSPVEEIGLMHISANDILGWTCSLYATLDEHEQSPEIPDVHYSCIKNTKRVFLSIAAVLCDLAGLRLDQYSDPGLGDVYSHEFPLASRDAEYCMSLGTGDEE